MAWLVTLSLQCSPRTSAQPTRMGVRDVEHAGILGSNCKAWDLSSTLKVWDSSVRILRPWAFQLQQLTFVMCFSQGSYQADKLERGKQIYLFLCNFSWSRTVAIVCNLVTTKSIFMILRSLLQKPLSITCFRMKRKFIQLKTYAKYQSWWESMQI